ARIAVAVLSTSSPSSSPDMRVSPTVSAPKMRARCEMDLSPGTRARPLRAPARRAVSGDLAAWSTDELGFAPALSSTGPKGRHRGHHGGARGSGRKPFGRY